MGRARNKLYKPVLAFPGKPFPPELPSLSVIFAASIYPYETRLHERYPSFFQRRLDVSAASLSDRFCIR